MEERSQLNVVLSKELIRAVKAQARRQGMSLSQFVNSCLLEAIEGKSEVNIDQRIVTLEEELNSLKNALISSKILSENFYGKKTKVAKSKISYSNEGAKLYSQALKEAFNQIGQDLMLSLDSTWNELKKQPAIKNAASIDPNYLSFCHEVLKGSHILKGSEIEDSLNNFQSCPCKEGLSQLSGKSLPELDFALNDAEVYPD
ncbi:hypothetical protein [Prochlorococcus sp. MIT 1307]|uniref:hypothetical protein n=1 Tax=Prochlorococcus sp. MIT 1307 TaxID=3096219 RepID=UPI002A758490|nr:hypothetical protein [Prochlorococcus sp. MIT 1307]